MKQLQQLFKSVPARVGVASGALMLAGTSMAADEVDVTAILAKLAAGVVAVTAVATAALAVVIVVKVFKYVRTAM